MKTYVRYTIICLFTLSSALCGAESRTVSQNFNTLVQSGSMTLNTPANTIGETDFVKYTCSGGAEFSYSPSTSNEIAIFLDASGEQVETTTQVTNLDSLRIIYSPTEYREMKVSISTDGSVWQEVATQHKTNGIRTVKMPRAGNYFVRIAYESSNNVYIKQIDYIYIDLSGCPNCFIYKPE